LLESHDGFIAAVDQFLERISQVETGLQLNARQVQRFAGRLAKEFRELQWGMGCHERYEESKLYPFLAQRFGAVCEPLAEQHESLHALGAECETLLAAAAAELATGSPLDLVAAKNLVDDYRQLLTNHLRQEEEIVIPLLLSMSPREFQCYSVAAESCAAVAAP